MPKQVVLFYGHRQGKKITDSCFSQFYPCEFAVDGKKYNCAEQFMMAEKAKAFGDEQTREKILAEDKPAKIKALGRRVKPFDAKLWASMAENVVMVGNFAKFSQNPDLKAYLLSTGDAILAEASPKDCIWGIGMGKHDARASDPKNWRGRNQLGFALMQVREALPRNGGMSRFRTDHPIPQLGADVLAMLNSSIAAKKAYAVAKSASRAANPGRQVKRNKSMDSTLDLSERTENTMRDFIRKVQTAVIPTIKVGGDSTSLTSLEASFTAAQQAAKIKFDKIYRPFVYKVLVASPAKDGLGFKYKQIYDSQNCRYKVPYRGEISGEEVYSEVWMRLFGTDGNKPALLNFNVAQPNVGHGAFRLYLRLITKSVYYDLTRKETMTLKDIHGHIIYKFDQKTKKYLLDKHGKKIPVRVPRSETSDENVISRALSSAYSETRAKKLDRTVFQRRISLKYLAYLHVHETKLNKSGWFYRASVEMFESGVPMEDVLAGCLQRGDITQRQSFDTALSRFRAAIDDKTAELSKAIFSADDAKVTSEGELLDREWMATAKKFGMSRVKDVRLRVMAAMMDAFESGVRT